MIEKKTKDFKSNRHCIKQTGTKQSERNEAIDNLKQ